MAVGVSMVANCRNCPLLEHKDIFMLVRAWSPC
jgi:hypothetical protein